MEKESETYSMLYEYEGSTFEANTSAEEHELMQDPDYFENYIQTCNSNKSIANDEPTSQENIHGTEFSWGRKSTVLLIEQYKLHKHKFRDPKIKKKGIWNLIKTEFQRMGYMVTDEILDRKWRNLKKTYTGIKTNVKSTGRGRISWDYFESFEDIYRDDKTINVPKTLSTMPVMKQGQASVNAATPPLTSPFFCEASTATCSQYSAAAVPFISSREGSTPSEITLTSQSVTASQTPSGSSTPRSATAGKMSALYRYRKRQEEIEERRIDEIRLLRVAIEDSNNIQRKRNEILEKMLHNNK